MIQSKSFKQKPGQYFFRQHAHKDGKVLYQPQKTQQFLAADAGILTSRSIQLTGRSMPIGDIHILLLKK